MTGRKPLFAVSLLLPAMAPVDALAADVHAQSSTRFYWHNDPSHPLNDPGNPVVFPGNKAAIFR